MEKTFNNLLTKAVKFNAKYWNSTSLKCSVYQDRKHIFKNCPVEVGVGNDDDIGFFACNYKYWWTHSGIGTARKTINIDCVVVFSYSYTFNDLEKIYKNIPYSYDDCKSYNPYEESTINLDIYTVNGHILFIHSDNQKLYYFLQEHVGFCPKTLSIKLDEILQVAFVDKTKEALEIIVKRFNDYKQKTFSLLSQIQNCNHNNDDKIYLIRDTKNKRFIGLNANQFLIECFNNHKEETFRLLSDKIKLTELVQSFQ